MEGLLPDNERQSFADVRGRMGDIANDLFDPNKYDDPVLKNSIPMVFRIFNWIPVLCWWLIWKPLPLTRLSVADRQRLFHKMEHSRLYALRGLYVAAKMFACMVFFHDESTWDYVGYDNEGLLARVINRTPLDDLEVAS